MSRAILKNATQKMISAQAKLATALTAAAFQEDPALAEAAQDLYAGDMANAERSEARGIACMAAAESLRIMAAIFVIDTFAAA